ncbi:DUF488 domain-containing protein [Arenibacter certesii]|uniref:DUF488 domain-containing protein n=1 Tax=Arenibacter certesii TaxID=228955 RepID=A0A918ITH7_9FLAO|nr:DUF488 domain-containing protein [Arenibacter certesii]GGW30161.1 hypothetical protein GCM10007383_14290 [Arenibacter certesii]
MTKSGSMSNKTIWTIGHSTRTIEEFLEMLRSCEIELIVDIRRFPGSKKYPQYNKELLERSLLENDIAYKQLEKLGGRRKINALSTNIAWRNPSFRAYADYMETSDFKSGLGELLQLAYNKRTAYMCSEAVWWRCHRSLVSDILKFNGWEVRHIMGVDKTTEHSYTGPATVSQNGIIYSEKQG